MLVNGCDSKYQREHVVILCRRSQKHIPEDQDSMPTPRMHWSPWRSLSPSSSVASGSFPVTAKWTVLSEIQQPPEHREGAEHPVQAALWLAKHMALVGRPCAIQGPGSPHSVHQHLGYTQAEGRRYDGTGAQQSRYLDNKLLFFKHLFAKCRNSKSGCL